MGRETRDELRRQLKEEKSQNARLRRDLHAMGLIASNVLEDVDEVLGAMGRLRAGRRSLKALLGRLDGISDS